MAGRTGTGRARAAASTAKKKARSAKKSKASNTKQGFGTGAGRRTKFTAPARAKFLAELADHGFVSIAAAAIGMSRRYMYELRKKDEELAAEWDDAVEKSLDHLEKEARRRAEAGVMKPVYQGGKRVGQIREFSDSLMALMLKARRRRVYGERAADGSVDGTSSGVLKVRGALDDDAWDEEYGK